MSLLIDRQRLLRQLQGYNPWWEGRTSPLDHPFRRIAFQLCLAPLLEKSLRRAVVLNGPRRVGKSCVLNQIASELVRTGSPAHSVLYLSLDDNLLKLVPLREILAAYREMVYAEGRQAYLLLDEVHYARDWAQEIKTIVDHQPDYRLLVTGSANLEFHAGASHAGVGRWHTVPIPTLSFYEFLHLRQEAPSGLDESIRVLGLHQSTERKRAEIASRLRPTQPAFLRYLLVGGFPETARLDQIELCQKLLREDVVDRVLKRDMTALFGVRNVSELEQLFLYICLHTGGALNVQSCASELGSTRATISSHLDLLVQSHLLLRLSPEAKGGKRLLKPRHKYFVADAALRNAMFLTGDDVLKNPDEMGLIIETTVLRHVLSSFYRHRPTTGYWQHPASDAEVDMVMRFPGHIVPIEVKYREQAKLKRSAGLRLFCEAEPAALPILVTQRESDFAVERPDASGPAILRIPAHIFCYLVGQAEPR